MYRDLSGELLNKGIRPLSYRIKVLEYLSSNRNHPTVDQIYTDLKEKLPSVSKATVYNTLNLFEEHDMVKVISINNKEKRYDYAPENHGHFMCEACNGIYDFDINIDSIRVGELSDFVVETKDIYFKGFCPNCLSRFKKIKI